MLIVETSVLEYGPDGLLFPLQRCSDEQSSCNGLTPVSDYVQWHGPWYPQRDKMNLITHGLGINLNSELVPVQDAHETTVQCYGSQDILALDG